MPVKILLVDDDFIDRMAVRRALRQTPLQADLREAASGVLGLQLLQEEAFDCVLLDYQLPDMDGLEFMGQLVATDALRAVPIVILTGHGSEAIAVEALKHGAQDYLVKGQVEGPLLARTVRYAIERQRSEEALRQQRAWLDATLSSIGEAIIATDTSGHVTFMNPVAAVLTGWSAEAARGHHIDAVLHLRNEQTRQAVTSPVSRVLQEGVVIGLGNHIELIARDGRPIPIADSAAPIRSSSGSLYGVVLAFRDISERKYLEAQLRQSQKMEAIGTLAAGIAHDFNNILTAILGFTELAVADIPAASPVSRSLQQVLIAGLRARDLVQQILAFSRQTAVTYQPVQLQVLIRETLALLQASLPSTIAMQQHLATDVDTVLAEPTQIHQVVLNLCANAEYAMRETGGVLEVHLEAITVDATSAAVSLDLRPGPYARLLVRDTGPGIAPEVLGRIFEPFFTTKGVGEGTGMGLAIVHGIVTNHGGAITVSSTPGQGATFEVYLPRCAEVAAHDTAP